MSVGFGFDFEHELGRDRISFVEKAFVREDSELAQSFDLFDDGEHEARAFFFGLASKLDDFGVVNVKVVEADDV